MRKSIYLLCAFMAILASCSKYEARQEEGVDEAELLMQCNPDSALHILESIDPSDLETDSLKAKFYYLKAYCHMNCDHSMIGDSLVFFAHNYYRGKDIVKDIRSGTALAWYKFWIGDTSSSIAMLDSLVGLPNVPDSLMVQTLRIRVLLGASEYQGRQIIPLAKRLYKLETDALGKMEAKYMLLSGYEYAGDTDSAIHLVNELVDDARSRSWGDKQFQFEIERAQLLTEAGREEESDKLVSEIFHKAGPENGAADILHFQYAINALNRGDVSEAEHHISIADSLAARLRGDDDAYFRAYSNLLHAMIDFKQTGRIKLMHINRLNNRLSEQLSRMETSQWEAEREALHQQNRTLSLKADNEHKAVIILIMSLAVLLTLGVCAWAVVLRRQRERDSEERIEALQKMVDEYKADSAQVTEKADYSAARGIMLKHLGIIKMVAETPTEQNREMLRRISAIDGETDGELVDWKKVFEIIDNLYSDFYSKLHRHYGDLLSVKEEQIIVLMLAGFSTKEISVITGQTTSTIYVRKSSIRKKLGAPEKGDIVEFVRGKEKD